VSGGSTGTDPAEGRATRELSRADLDGRVDREDFRASGVDLGRVSFHFGEPIPCRINGRGISFNFVDSLLGRFDRRSVLLRVGCLFLGNAETIIVFAYPHSCVLGGCVDGGGKFAHLGAVPRLAVDDGLVLRRIESEIQLTRVAFARQLAGEIDVSFDFLGKRDYTLRGLKSVVVELYDAVRAE
jgi:hypothetical protein